MRQLQKNDDVEGGREKTLKKLAKNAGMYVHKSGNDLGAVCPVHAKEAAQ